MKRPKHTTRWITVAALAVAMLVSALVVSTCAPVKVEPLPIPVSSSL